MTFLQQLQERGLLKARGRQRIDSTHVLAAVRDLNRLERVRNPARGAESRGGGRSRWVTDVRAAGVVRA